MKTIAMIDTTGKLIAAFSFIAFAINIPPFCYHFGRKNIPACSLMFWLSFNTLTSFINALIWSGENFAEVSNAPGYCDLTVRIFSGSSAGKICTIACLMLNLFMIIDASNHKFLDPKSKRRVLINLAMCWLTPIIIMGTSLIVQNSRYVIVRYRGCIAPYGYSYVTLLLVTIWPLVWSIVALVFAALTIWTFFQKRRDVKDLLRCTNSGLTLRRFSRLLIFSLLIMFITCPFAIYVFASDMNTYEMTTFSWPETHDQYWGHIFKLDFGTKLLSSRIIDIVLSVISFLLFGLGTDALEMYRKFLVRLGLKKFRKRSSEEALIQNENSDNYQDDKEPVNTGETDETVASMFEFSNNKELVFAEPVASPEIFFDTTKNEKFEAGSSPTISEEWNHQLSSHSRGMPDIRFNHQVHHHKQFK